MWDSAARLGKGTFGTVYQASGPGYGPLAAKVIQKAKSTTREQLIAADAPSSPYVVPILHVEETTDHFVLYMPRADFSLRQKINEGVTASEAVQILADLSEALAAIAPFVVHRDLKPENVLYLNGTWALCDFGIARYAEAATASDTSKGSFTPEYAAPEQWRLEHATAATDVYAFGVIAYELLGGERPFDGDQSTLRQQHLNVVPDLLPGNRKLSWIVAESLSKAPQARPAAGNLIERLKRAGAAAASPGGNALAAAQSAVIQARSAEHAAAEAARTEYERRQVLFESCQISYGALMEALVEFITDGAPATESLRPQGGGVTLLLGSARITMSGVYEFAGSDRSSFDVIGHGQVVLENHDRSRSRSHALYFADFGAPGAYSWFEMGFIQAAFGTGADFDHEPRALPPGQGLDALDTSSYGLVQLGYGVVPLEAGDPDRFVDFWAERFGQAAAGRFPRIFQLPDGKIARPTRR